MKICLIVGAVIMLFGSQLVGATKRTAPSPIVDKKETQMNYLAPFQAKEHCPHGDIVWGWGRDGKFIAQCKHCFGIFRDGQWVLPIVTASDGDI